MGSSWQWDLVIALSSGVVLLTAGYIYEKAAEWKDKKVHPAPGRIIAVGDHKLHCRVIDAFVEGLTMSDLGFERAMAAETGRPGYDPRDLLKLYLYGYLNQIRSSRRLEAECRRNVELMWLLDRLYPDHKSIAEFRRMHRDAVIAAGAELIRFARSCGLIRGEWIAIDGSKFRAVASIDSTRERVALQRYIDSIEKADEEQQASIGRKLVDLPAAWPLNPGFLERCFSPYAAA
jgi:transposase